MSLDDVPVALVAVDGGRVVGANAEACALLGLPDADCPGLEGVLEWSETASARIADLLTHAPTAIVELPGPSHAAAGGSLLATARRLDGASRVLLHLHEPSADGTARGELERRLQFERLLTEAAAALIRSNDAELDSAIEGLLGSVGRFFGVDRAYVFLIDPTAMRQSNTHEWVAPGISREAHNLQDLPLDTFPWLLEELRADRIVCVECLDDLPAAAFRERAEFEREGIQSILIVPLWIAGTLRGFVGFDAVRGRVVWDEPFVIGLRLMSQVLASALDARELSRRLKAQALHDALTGLPNRTLLQDRFEQTARRARRGSEHVLLAVVDVDDFKHVNDRHGHPAGDALLRALGARLREVLRDTDTVARIGGDEFVILANGAAPDDLRRLAQRLLSTVDTPFDVGTDEPVRVGLSIGLAREDVAPDIELDTLLRGADAAMYAAKSGGKNRWSQAMPAGAREHGVVEALGGG
ncbi:hypothetical protein GCM10027188_22930 [Lysobacter humi (ex Lee et al. 2017)]